jgi:hypothetical protein
MGGTVVRDESFSDECNRGVQPSWVKFHLPEHTQPVPDFRYL